MDTPIEFKTGKEIACDMQKYREEKLLFLKITYDGAGFYELPENVDWSALFEADDDDDEKYEISHKYMTMMQFHKLTEFDGF